MSLLASRWIPLSVSSLVIASMPASGADFTIPGQHVTAPDNGAGPGPQTVALAMGLAELSVLDPQAASEISADIANGTLKIGVLHESLNKDGGMSDGDTMSINLDDNPDSIEIAVRLRHELEHHKNGIPLLGLNGGGLLPCEHFDAFLLSYNKACAWSCAIVGVSCDTINQLLTQAVYFAELCSQIGGHPNVTTIGSSCDCD
jgi:hypothetical protein